MSRRSLGATVQRSARAAAVAAALLLASAGGALAAPAFVAPFEPLPGGITFLTPAMNAGGEALFADRVTLAGGKLAYRVTSRAPDGTVAAPVVLPPAGSTTLQQYVPATALADDGHAIVAWADGGKANYALRSPDGSWSAPAQVVASTNVTSVVAGIDANGVATLGWAENSIPTPTFGDSNTAFVKVVRISAGGSVSGTQTVLSPPVSSSAAVVSKMNVAGTGPAVFAYAMNSVLAFSFSETLAFRDSATGSFGSAADVPTGLFGSGSAVAVGNDGRAAFATISGADIALRVRDPGGALSAPANIGAQENAFNVQIGVAGDGAITLAWDLQTGADPRVLACTATPTDCIGDPQRLSPPAPSVTLTGMAVDAAGAALAAWNDTTFTPTVIRRAKSAFRPAGAAAFGPSQDIAPAPAQGASVALDAAGDGVATFDGGVSPAHEYKAAGFDATGPRIDAFGAPGSLAQGARGAFSASASDLWSPFGLAWSFGDGTGASGSPVAHAFAGAGSFPVTLTATDAVGNSTSRTAAVAVRDTVAPAILGLTISTHRFHVGAKPTATAAARRRATTPLGATIRYSLSEAATATFAIDRAQAGRRVGRACRKPTRANRRRHACTRFVRAGVLTRRARTGANRLAFSGRIGRKALAPGTYRLTLTARDAAGNVSRSRSLMFTIARR